MYCMSGTKKIAVIVVLENSQNWLMLKRKYPPNQDLYTPVGGKLEPGESPRAAALREAREEAGIKLQNISYCGVLVDSAPTDYNWVCFVYRAEVEYFKPPFCNEGVLSWIPISTLHTIPKPATDPYLYSLVLARTPFYLSAVYSKDNQLISLTEEISGTCLFGDNLHGH